MVVLFSIIPALLVGELYFHVPFVSALLTELVSAMHSAMGGSDRKLRDHLAVPAPLPTVSRAHSGRAAPLV